MKTSSECSRFVMRAESQAVSADVVVESLPSAVLPSQAKIVAVPAMQDEQPKTRKVILAPPGMSDNDVATNLTAVAVGTLRVLAWAVAIAVAIMVGLVWGCLRGARSRR